MKLFSKVLKIKYLQVKKNHLFSTKILKTLKINNLAIFIIYNRYVQTNRLYFKIITKIKIIAKLKQF